MNSRKLPVYLLIDVSGGMHGEPMAIVNSELKKFVATLNERASIFVSIITFGNEARQVFPLTPVSQCKLPELEADGMRALGPALSLLCTCRNQECPPTSKTWYDPCVLVLMGGPQGEGDFQKGIADFKSQHWGRYMFGSIGDDCDFHDLQRINREMINPLREKPLFEAVRSFFMMALNEIEDFHEICCERTILHGDDEQPETFPLLPDAVHVDTPDGSSEDKLEDADMMHDGAFWGGETHNHDNINFSLHERRLPIYLLVDVSASMEGEPIQLVHNAIQQLIADLRDDPWAIDKLWISVITFSDDAQQVVPLSDMEGFQAPELETGGKTNLGAALSLLCECRDHEVRIRNDTLGIQGDYRPMVFVFTDGKTDVGDLEKGICAFKARKWERYAFCAVGPDANVAMLKQINCVRVVNLENLSSGALSTYVRRFWMDDGSIKISSAPLRKRLTAYMAIDSSETMKGLPMEAIQLGLKQLASDLSHCDTCQTELLLGVISLGDEAVELVEPIAPGQIVLPSIETSSRAAIWKGLELLSECAKRYRSEYPPLLFLLSADGRKTEGMDEGLKAFQSQAWGKMALCAAGPGADVASLLQIDRKAVFQLQDLRPTTLLKYFDWVSTAIQAQLNNINTQSKTDNVSV